MLLEWDADVNLCAEETPLTAACRNGQQEIVNRLLKKTAGLISKTNDHGMTPLEVAVNNGHTALAMNLLKDGAALPSKVPFHSLCQLVDTKRIRDFLQDSRDRQTADEKLLSVVVKDDNF